MLVRNLPYDDLVVPSLWEALAESVDQELDAAINIYHPCTHNWDSLFSPEPSFFPRPLANGYPFDRAVYTQIAQCLAKALPRLRTTLYYPDYSNKTIGVAASRIIERFTREYDDLHVENTTRGLEILYCRSGIMIGGPTEVRWAFRFNDLRPRIYYARGPDQYYPSRYIQQIFNIIVDCFPMVHRFGRYITDIIRLSRSDTLFIYDYSAFTSKLHEIKNFTAFLSRYFSGVMVTVVDSRKGPISIDLGELLNDFNMSCNDFPTFDLGRLDRTAPYEENLTHHNCGMLGVPGNISSCTLLHGIHLAIVMLSILVKCVGDDAIAAGEIDNFAEEIFPLLQNIGDIKLEKTIIWEPDRFLEDETEEDPRTWHYTKRPIRKQDSRIVIGWQAIFPPFGLVYDVQDPIHTTFKKSIPEKMRRIAHMSLAFALQFSPFLGTLTEEEHDLCHNILGSLRLEVRRKFKGNNSDSGFLKQLIHMMPCSLGESAIDDVVFNLRDLIILWPYPDDGVRPEGDIKKGEEFCTRMLPSIKLARDMGFMDVSIRERYCLGSDIEDEIRARLNKTFRYSYSCRVLDYCPVWLLDLVNIELHSTSIPDVISKVGDHFAT